MTEEIKVEDQQVEQPEVIEQSPVELEAREQGWVPKEEFEGEDAKWVDAGEFVRRGELFKKIEHQSREVKSLRKAINDFKELHSKVNEAAYQRALTDLKREYKTANREGDFEKADKLEAEIETVEAEAVAVKQQIQQVAQETQINPEFASWVTRNDWYATQPHMKTFADYKGLEFAKLGLTPTEVLRKVEAEVRKEFPTKFNNPNRARPGTVESSTQKPGRQSEDKYELTEQERRVMKTFVNTKGKDGKPFMTEKEYIASLKQIKGAA